MSELIRRVATYERVSSEDQRERQTIKTQSEELARRLAGDASVELVERYIDDGVSGTIPMGERPAGRRLMEDASRGLFSELWVYKVDRLGRDDVDPLVVWQELERLAVKVHSVTEGISDLFMYHIHVAVAAQERRNFLQRSAAGMNRAANEGRYTGGIVPLGYRVEGKKPHVHLVPDETILWGDLSAAEVVRRMYRLAAEGWSCRKIADEFNRLGIATVYQRDGRGVRGKSTQGRWGGGRILSMLMNPVYRGLQKYGRRTKKRERDIIEARVARLVSDELWEAAQQTRVANRVVPPSTSRRTYLLRSVTVCGVCGHHYHGIPGREGVFWYRCAGRKIDGVKERPCPGKSIKGPVLDGVVWDDLERWLRDPGDVIEELQVFDERSEQQAVTEAERVTLEAALVQLAQQRKNAVGLGVRGVIGEEDLRQQLGELEAQQRHVEERLRQLGEVQAEPVEEPIDGDVVAALRGRVERGFSDEERHEIVRLLVKKIVVWTEFEESGRKMARVSIDYRFPQPGVVSTHTGRGSWRRRGRSWRGR